MDAEKPSFGVLPGIARIVDFLQDGHKPGWFRFSADLLNLAEESQELLADMVERLASMTRQDGLHHNSIMAFAGSWGYPTLFMGSKPRKMPIQDASTRLAAYGIAKKHQIKSDRALMVVFDEEQRIRSIRYDNSPPVENRELDGFVAEMGLIPPAVMGRSIPPSARRATARLNPSRKAKNRSKRGR